MQLLYHTPCLQLQLGDYAVDKLENPTQNYTVVPNEVFDRDLNLSSHARYLYIYLISRPSGWQIRSSDIQNVIGCKRDYSYKLLKELRDAGTLSYQRLHDGGGLYTLHKITTSCFIASDTVASDETAHIVNTERAVNTKSIVKSSDQTAFDLWWQQYPKKVSKKEALKAWNKIKPDADLLIADTINKATNDDGWLRGYIPNPTTYLNQERWNDELQRPKPSEQSLPEQYAARKQRTAAILQKLNGCDVGDYVTPLLPAMVEDLW